MNYRITSKNPQGEIEIREFFNYKNKNDVKEIFRLKYNERILKIEKINKFKSKSLTDSEKKILGKRY